MSDGIALGVIADDFTGAADAASFLSERGHRTFMVTGSVAEAPYECDCLVIALKVRSAPIAEALEQVDRALDALLEHNAQRIYFKFCSTFDSTPRGNIGPIMDRLMERLGQARAVLCPSLPVNGRTVRDGSLYVNGVPLDESPMRNHPLNPMWDHRIPALMEPQSAYPCQVVRREDLAAGRTGLEDADPGRRYLVPDYETDDDACAIGAAYRGLRLFGGGSGLLPHLLGPAAPSEDSRRARSDAGAPSVFMVCGSCSEASRAQIECFEAAGGTTIPVDSKLLITGGLGAADLLERAKRARPLPVLVYSDAVMRADGEPRSETFDQEARSMERVLSDLCASARDAGYERIVAAGGETSGAAAIALNYDAYLVGSSIAPGVPLLYPVEDPDRSVVFKSGNFGGREFFVKVARDDPWTR